MTIFEKELRYFKSNETKAIVEQLLTKVPTYFWTIPASSSGKYHPAYALGEGGLVRHTKAAVRFFTEQAVLWELTDTEYDSCLAALLLHDTFKQGEGEGKGHTVFEHPLLSAKFIRDNAPQDFADNVCPLIESHMGQWNTNKYSDTVLPKPTTELERIVHQCDFLASRKAFDIVDL